MKGFVVVLCVYLVTVDAYPQFLERHSEPSDEVEEIEIGDREARLPAAPFDYPAGPGDFFSTSFIPFRYDNNPFDSFMTRMQEILIGLKDRMDVLVNRFPSQNGTFIDLGNEPVQNKSTSTTKVIDGHVVTVNETTYSTGDEDNSAVFHFEIIELKPTSKPTTDNSIPTDSTESPSTPVEEKPEDSNEIPRENKVSFAEWDSSETLTNPNPSWNEVDIETFDEDSAVPPPVDASHSHKTQEPARLIDLSGDILVNKLISEQENAQGLVMIDPDAELIEVIKKPEIRPGEIDVEMIRSQKYRADNNNNEMKSEYYQYEPMVDIVRL